MYFVYILQSVKDNNFYTGCTSDLRKRLKAHNSGKVKSTQKRKPFRLVYFEEHETLSQARCEEDYLKTYEGGRQKRNLVDAFPKEKIDSMLAPRALTGPLAEV